MVEVPSTAVLADQFAKLIDFFSISTERFDAIHLGDGRVHPAVNQTGRRALNQQCCAMNMTVRAAKAEQMGRRVWWRSQR